MTDPVFDSASDPQVDAVAGLLYGAIRAKYGTEACVAVKKWPVRFDLLPGPNFPLLAVYRTRESNEAIAATTEEDAATVVVQIDYYLPPTPADRIDLRWPFLRAAWALCLSRLRIGWDQAVSSGARDMQTAGIAVPSPVTGTVQYLISPSAEAASGVIPMFQASVSLPVRTFFDWSDYELDDLTEIATTSTIDGDAGFENLDDDLDL